VLGTVSGKIPLAMFLREADYLRILKKQHLESFILLWEIDQAISMLV
jgi:hypothetical protein